MSGFNSLSALCRTARMSSSLSRSRTEVDTNRSTLPASNCSPAATGSPS